MIYHISSFITILLFSVSRIFIEWWTTRLGVPIEETYKYDDFDLNGQNHQIVKEKQKLQFKASFNPLIPRAKIRFKVVK